MSTAPSDPRLQIAESAAKGTRATLIGVAISCVLAAIKIISGIAGYSYALIADGVESMLDVFSALVVVGTLKIAAAPPSDRYPYGYGKAEPMGAAAVAGGLLIAATVISIQSIREILTPHHLPASWTLGVLVVVVATKEGLFRYLSRTGKDIQSSAVKTDAWHHRSDALTSAAAFIGITIALIGGRGYESADDWAALFACVIIASNGLRLLRNALHDMMDAAPPPDLHERIRETFLHVSGVEEVDKCLIRKSGLGYFVDAHIEVDGRLPVRDGHEIAHRAKDKLMESELPILDANIHVEPFPNPYKQD